MMQRVLAVQNVINKYRIIMLIILLLTAAFSLTGCKDATSPNYDENRIRDILYDVQSAFNSHDIDALMTHFSTSYLHEGQTLWLIRQVWLQRMSAYLLIDMENLEITVTEDRAVASFRMKLQNAEDTIWTDEPADNGDISYFAYENGDWKICGNQHR